MEKALERSRKEFIESYLKDFEETERMKQQDYQDYLNDILDVDRPPVLGGSFLDDCCF